MESNISTWSVRDLLHETAKGRVQLLDEGRQVPVSLNTAAAVLDSLRRGAPLGMLTLTQRVGDGLPVKVVADGAVRMAVFAGAFLSADVRPAWAPAWLAELGYIGLGTDQIGIGVVDPADPTQLPTQAVLQTRDFLVWERRVREIAPAGTLGPILQAANHLTKAIYTMMPAVTVFGTDDEVRQVVAQANTGSSSRRSPARQPDSWRAGAEARTVEPVGTAQ
ncbi:hypothetical protein [Micromonospora chersina]|uniref:hypothetical protein n=1 Tax=Micromonospora chersina TaxID=47854 RepID=UPI0033AAB07C